MKRKHIFDTEILTTSKYCKIIMNILNTHKELSVFKLMCIAFLEKKQSNRIKQLYNSNNKNDIINKYLSQLSGQFNNMVNDLVFIIKAVHLLINNNCIIEKNGILFSSDAEPNDDKKNFSFVAIEKCKKYSEKQFLKEILSYV